MWKPLSYPWEALDANINQSVDIDSMPWCSQILINKEEEINNATTGATYPTKQVSDIYNMIELPGPSLQGDSSQEIKINIDNKEVSLDYCGEGETINNINFEYFFDKIMNAMLFLTRDVECLNVKNYKFQTVYWQTILFRLHQHTDIDPARYALVVDLSELNELIKPIDRITSQPKKVLRRVYDQERIQKVREIDKKCVIDLARRPGSVLAEKAGPKQRILAIKRQENINILENRVTKHCCELAIRAAKRYIEQHKKENITAKESKRVKSVEKLLKESTRLPHKEQFRGVTNLSVPCRQPNYTLMQNADYHKVWKAYVELVRNEDLRSELWKWYRRMWCDYTGVYLADMMYLLNTIIEDNEIFEIGNKAVMGKRRQEEGNWLFNDILPGPFVVASGDLQSTLYIVHGDVNTLSKISDSLRCLASCNADYIVIKISDGNKSVMPIYSIVPPHHLNKKSYENYIKDMPSNLIKNINSFKRKNNDWNCNHGWILMGNWNDSSFIDRLQNLGEGMTCWITDVNPDYSFWKDKSNSYKPMKAFLK